MSRREKVRENTREEIKEIARQQMSTMGAALLSLNAIAREMEMTTPGLYRYFANRDELITAVLTDAQNEFVAALQASIGAFPETAYQERLEAAMLMYREWAIAHPIEYQLIACAPIPDYQAPPEVWQNTGVNIFGIFLNLLQVIYDAGFLTIPDYHHELPKGLSTTIPFPAANGAPFASVVAYQGVMGWYRMHGLIMLEMFHYLDPVVSDPAAYYRHEIRSLIYTTEDFHKGETL